MSDPIITVLVDGEAAEKLKEPVAFESFSKALDVYGKGPMRDWLHDQVAAIQRGCQQIDDFATAAKEAIKSGKAIIRMEVKPGWRDADEREGVHQWKYTGMPPDKVSTGEVTYIFKIQHK